MTARDLCPSSRLRPTARKTPAQRVNEYRSTGRRDRFRPRLVIMVKVPRLGSVKTRLGREIGPVAATFFYRHASRALMHRLARDPRFQVILSVSPDADRTSVVWPSFLHRMGQGRGDLGARMLRPFDCLPPGPVIVIGSDIPQVQPQHIAGAFRKIDGKDVVLGPAEDGGFWLVGLRRRRRVLRPFAGVTWSSSDTMANTLQNLQGYRVGFAATLNDVDHSQDFERVRNWSGRIVQPFIAMP